jgi:hypothetical protein
VPKWSGGETAPPINEFFEIIEVSAAIGNWTEADQKQMCVIKLTDAARAFYSVTPELRDPAITWQEFKELFCRGFEMLGQCNIISGNCIWRDSAKAKQRKSS